MPRSRDLLARFRPAGTPGAAAATGVPADRVAERSAELEPVLAQLADTETEVARLLTEASAEAERRRAEGDARARAVVAAARQQAEAERADAAGRVRRQGEGESAEIAEAARREADDIGRRADARTPGLVARVVATVRADLGFDDQPARAP